MRAGKIRPGMTLRLKPARAEAYGMMSDPLVVVSALKPRPGYKVPWVMSGELAFAPSDFSGEVVSAAEREIRERREFPTGDEATRSRAPSSRRR